MKIGKTFIWLTTVYSFTPSLVFLPQYFLHIMYLSMFLAGGGEAEEGQMWGI